MKGNMMNWNLTIPQAISHAEKYNFDGKLISREVDGSITSTTYGASIQRSKKLANALTKLGVKLHDRVGTIAWNNSRHFETYFAVSGMGAVLHTMNPALPEPSSGRKKHRRYSATTTEQALGNPVHWCRSVTMPYELVSDRTRPNHLTLVHAQ